MEITHLGHACLLVEMAGTRLLLDPGEFTPDLSAASRVDAIVFTHQHLDHLDRGRLPDLIRTNPNARLLADPESARIITGMGFDVTAQDGTPQAIDGVTVTPVGTVHALIHQDIPRVANVGVVLSAENEPTFYHPGDTLEEDPGPVDVVAFPLSAPWQRSREMTGYLRRLAAPSAIPIHDALLSPTGRRLYLSQAAALGSADTRIHDLAGQGATAFSRE